MAHFSADALPYPEGHEQALSAVWQPMATAPRDGTAIQARIPGHGADNVIMWIADCLENENGPCGSWVFAHEDQEPPDDWTDGYCWGVNEDGVPSSWPTEWKPLAPAGNSREGK